MDPRVASCFYHDHQLCRSCGWFNRNYQDQITEKENRIREALGFFGAISLAPPFKSSLLGFRNRAKMAVTGTLEHPTIGITGGTAGGSPQNPSRTPDIHLLDAGQELLDCPIHHPKLNDLLKDLPALIKEHQLPPYRIQERKGELKGLIAFISPKTGQSYLRFVLRSKDCVSKIKKLVPVLRERFWGLTCISVNIQPIPHAILEGPEELILTERTDIDHQLGTLLLKLTPQAFVQTNATVAEGLYQTAAKWISETKPGKFLELFCGQGAFSFFAAPHVAQGLGIEINADAVQIANQTAKCLGLTHLEFKAANASQVEDQIASYNPDLILANPPRKGLDQSIQLIERFLPSNLIYSSCAIDTLASDLRKLSKTYRLKRAQLFDMFPHTEHFETLVWLERIKN